MGGTGKQQETPPGATDPMGAIPMMYELFLIDIATGAVADHLFVRADDRAEALARRPVSWPISRTRAARLRPG